jgi:esterase/lipase superfamily enzyme/outer membrane protein OmpA-like peptidoglycan-associated protein
MKKLISLAIASVMSILAVAQETAKPEVLMKQANVESEQMSTKAVIISGKVQDDGKTFFSDNKKWTIVNPDALKRKEGQRVTIEARVAADGSKIRVIQVFSVNLDNYRSVAETPVDFGFNNEKLSNDAKETLDQFASDIQNTKEPYVVTVEDWSDSASSEEYKHELNQHLADAVIQYLSSQHNVPPDKIYAIGASESATDSNQTYEGRAKDRRVRVRLMTLGEKGSISRPENYAVVRVFYATDRQPTHLQKVHNYYGPDRSVVGSLSFGFLDVSIPRDHQMGQIERPAIWRLEFREDPEKHVVLLGVSPEPEGQFFQDVSARVSGSAGKDAFVFIHGYANTFEEAAWRTAQLAYDLGFDGAPILYSWPSRGEVTAYPADEATIEWTTPHLEAFLEKLASASHARTVHLIAHSMGNRALTKALVSMAAKHSKNISPMFREVFLAAPDIDAGVFRQLAQSFPPLADRITLYASSKDEALRVSRRFHQNPRAGDSGLAITVVPRVDTIDATAVDTGLLGHSYYGDNRSILSDMFSLIRTGDPPEKRFGMQSAHLKQMTYWAFRP